MAVCDMDEILLGQVWILVQDQLQLTQVVVQLGRECQNWVHGEIKIRVQELIQRTVGLQIWYYTQMAQLL